MSASRYKPHLFYQRGACGGVALLTLLIVFVGYFLAREVYKLPPFRIGCNFRKKFTMTPPVS